MHNRKLIENILVVVIYQRPARTELAATRMNISYVACGKVVDEK
jgi:hypothetical protein